MEVGDGQKRRWQGKGEGGWGKEGKEGKEGERRKEEGVEWR